MTFEHHHEGCDKVLYEGGHCTCDLVGYGDYDDEPSNMAELEDGETFGDLW
jgi:hypothetical protein